MTQYATKNCRAELVKVNNLTEGLPYVGIWEEMCLHQQRFRYKHMRKAITNTAIDIEVSPTMEESKNWTLDDWRKFAEAFIAKLDTMTEGVDRNGKIRKGLIPTNLSNSQYFVALHRDSKSGIVHLHIIANRLDMDGNTNNSDFIGERAALAAQRMNLERGWGDTQEIHDDRVKQISDDVWDILRDMDKFSWTDYFNRIRDKGYSVYTPKRDGPIRSYSICVGNSHYRASDLGKGGCFTASKIEKTFAKLHPAPKLVLPTYNMVSQYTKIKGQHPNSILLFRKDNKFEAYKGDADNVAGVLGLHAFDSTRYGDENGDALRMVTFDESEEEQNIKLLTNAGFSVAICDFVQPKSEKNPVKQDNDYDHLQYQSSSPSRFKALWNIGGKDWSIDMPMSAYNTIDKEVTGGENDIFDHEEIVKTAALLFMGYIDAATTYVESYGGGGSTGGGWGRDKDDDEWARRCAAKAKWLCKPMKRSRSR